jgi:hypothetical protein
MTTQQGSPGFLSQVAPIIGTAAGAYFGGPAGAAIGNSLGNSIGNSSTNWFNSSPYGQNGPKASPSSMGTGFQAPNFLQSQGGY